MKYALAGLLLAVYSVGFAQLTIEDAGIWFEPDQPGHGLIITTWPDTPEVAAGGNVAWFTNTPDGSAQAWLLSENLIIGQSQVEAFVPMGAFPAFGHVLGDPAGQFELTKIDSERIELEYQIFIWPTRCDGRPRPGPLPNFCAGSIVFHRLTPPLFPSGDE